jgi:hypothetical protein
LTIERTFDNVPAESSAFVEDGMTRGRVTLGLLLTMVGGALLLDRIGGMQRAVSLLSDWWPLGVVGIGLASLVGTIKHPWSFIGPLVVVATGAALLLITTDTVKLEDARDAVGSYLAPVLVIALGGVIALVRPASGGADERRVRQSAVLVPKRVASDVRALQRGTATAILARLEVDLRKVRLDDDQPLAELDITALFGRVEILVPASWRVELHRPVGIGVRQTELVSAKQQSSDQADGRLKVHVLAFFGGAGLKQAA